MPLTIQQPRKLTHTEMARFHTDDYLNFLRLVSPDNMNDFMSQLHRCTGDVRVHVHRTGSCSSRWGSDND